MLSKSFFACLLSACLCACNASGTTVNQSAKQDNAAQTAQDEPKLSDNKVQTGETPPTAARQREIRLVDFGNFTYNAYCGGGSPTDGEMTAVTVKNGKYEGSNENFPNYFEIAVDAYGDLDGDGKEETAVSSLCNTGGTGQFSEGYVYTMNNGKPVLLTRFEGGDRGYGGLQSVKIENGFLFVERNDGKANCCADETLTAKYRWNGKKLVEIGKSVRRRLNAATPIRFAAGKSSKISELQFEAREIKTFVVGVSANQIITVTSNAKNVSIYPNDSVNTQSVTNEKISNGTKFKVSQNGNYGFSVQNLDYDNRKIIFNIEIK